MAGIANLRPATRPSIVDNVSLRNINLHFPAAPDPWHRSGKSQPCTAGVKLSYSSAVAAANAQAGGSSNAGNGGNDSRSRGDPDDEDPTEGDLSLGMNLAGVAGGSRSRDNVLSLGRPGVARLAFRWFRG